MPWTGEYADGGRPSFAKRSLVRSSSGKKWPWSRASMDDAFSASARIMPRSMKFVDE